MQLRWNRFSFGAVSARGELIKKKTLVLILKTMRNQLIWTLSV
jgi:hypothetical protein